MGGYKGDQIKLKTLFRDTNIHFSILSLYTYKHITLPKLVKTLIKNYYKYTILISEKRVFKMLEHA